jgi:hypothetical protein
MALRRVRGALLRLVRRRRVAMTAGALLVAPAAWIQISGRFDAWWIEGLSLVLGATGIAVFWTGLTGVPPDWIDET